MPAAQTPNRRPSADRSKTAKPPGEVVKTWAFDSVGTRKYAIQIRKAGNGNPCLKIVEGAPQGDGTFRKFHLTIWSEDFARFFETFDEVRTFMRENDIKTPAGHKYDPRPRQGRKAPTTRAAHKKTFVA